MEQVLEGIIKRYGTEVLWRHGEQEEALRGFFQSVTNRSWQKLLRKVGPLGEVDTSLYVYIGAVSPVLSVGDMLTVGDRSYRIRRTEILYSHEGPAYLWALCVRKGDGA